MTSDSEYFDDVGISATLRERIEEIRAAFAFLSPQPIQRLFVTDKIDAGDNQRKWDSVWGFTETYWLEAKAFQTVFDVDVSGFERSIEYLGISYEHIYFPPDGKGLPKTDEQSRLFVELRTAKRIDSAMSATGRNCHYLVDIIANLIQPNLRPEVV